ncbi:MAG TPA: SPASM domain-containing protein [Bacteroidia bacterium]|jgi:radical SAM protein with 4Fe4S-binding SPASM domain|nr:SPASM domain-containing protein [Bacteroidia bacterium]
MLAKLTDQLNMLSTLSPARGWNAGKVVLSYRLSRLTGKARHSGMPFSASIEPTTSCNLRCPECPSGKREFTRPTGMLKDDFFKELIDELAPHLNYLTFYFQGEPYLNPRFLDMVQYASSKNIYTATSTNAHYLTPENAKKTVESGLKRLIISIDGTTQDTYSSYRIGGTLDKVIEGAKNIVEWKKKLNSSTPYTIFQFLVVKANEHQIPEVKALAKQIGIDEVKLKTVQVYNHENGSPLIPTQQKYSRYKKDTTTGKYVIKNELLNHCWRSWHSCVITWDGSVVPCCFDKDAKHPMGNVKEHSFKELWQGDKYQNFRQALLRSRKEIDICQNCTEGTKVWG